MAYLFLVDKLLRYIGQKDFGGKWCNSCRPSVTLVVEQFWSEIILATSCRESSYRFENKQNYISTIYIHSSDTLPLQIKA